MSHILFFACRAKVLTWCTVLVVFLGACSAAAQNSGIARLERVFPELEFLGPIAMLQAPRDSNHWYVVEQAGRVMVFDDDPAADKASVFVDIRKRVSSRANESGLLGMAFHPDYQRNGQVILSYTEGRRNLTSVVSRFFLTDAGDALDPGSERVIMTLKQPFRNHNGGQVSFGSDGFLYLGFGDGGAAGDPQGHGQNTDTLLGAMLRIDVDRGDPYAIPRDNPFAGGGGRPELYAWGLRNPWRFSFDAATDELWAGDVGQNEIEEIDIIVKGGNYGWNRQEGTSAFRGDGPADELIAPVAEYSHSFGCSVTGGYVYRGDQIPALAGAYVFGDFCSGRFWSLTPDGSGGRNMAPLLDGHIQLSSFGEAHDGRLFAIDLDGGLFQIVADR